MREYIDVATIISTSHLDGRLSAMSADGLFSCLESAEMIHLVPPRIDLPREVHLAGLEPESPTRAIVRFAEIDSVDAAERVIGMHCLVEDDGMSPKGAASQNRACSFAGYSFEDLTSGTSGAISDVWDNAGSLVAEVTLLDDREGPDAIDRTFLIPIADDLIEDAGDSHLKLRLPKGIFEL